MSLRLYDLAGADEEVRFSPFCWRIKMALAHKGLAAETIPWRLSDKAVLAPTGQGRVPVLVDGDKWLNDSWAIAVYLDETYPAPPLFAGATGRAQARFINQWTDEILQPAMRPIIAPGILPILHEKDRPYYRSSREAALGITLEALAAQRDDALAALQTTLKPLSSTLSGQAFLSGENPAYADYIVFGAFMWARQVSAIALTGPDTPVTGWCERMLDAFDGLARRAKRAIAQ